MTALKILVAILISAVFTHAQAQSPMKLEQGEWNQSPSPTPTSDSSSTRHFRALRVTEPIKVDGRLVESAWLQAEAATGLRQEEPTEGAPASETTEVRVLYDDKNLYVGIRAFDSEPGRINARELVRDASFSNDDKVEILFDTYHDRRNAFRFAVNPLGTQ